MRLVKDFGKIADMLTVNFKHLAELKAELSLLDEDAKITDGVS